MNKKVQRISAMGGIALVLAFSAGQLDYAHSGRTDSSGGHKDNKNKSGLGYYHYHHDMDHICILVEFVRMRLVQQVIQI